MILILKPGYTEEELEHLLERIEEAGLTPHISKGKERTIVGAIGEERILQALPIESLPGVERAVPILKPYKVVSRDFKKEDSVVMIGDVPIGGAKIQVIAGPCAVEGLDMLRDIARKTKGSGSTVLRGGAYKPRTSPYSFQGLGEEGLKYLAEVREEVGLPVVTELMNIRYSDLVNKYADAIQVGARNMQNFDLLKEIGKMKKPVILKRGLSATIMELLMSAEYIASEGNTDIILCERGIRTFETETRNTLDINAVPVLKMLTHLPVVVDPSHATGRWELVTPIGLAGIAAGADGLLVEVHTNPEKAVSDGNQSLKPDRFQELMEKAKRVAEAVGRVM
ncbi:MAG: 3-deoxy-7-phosphoheptulonate synthase [Deltaproteobacteria bacterium]|uniref:3-deoxy-7-phosphoheptulonate synthase n=1 Tax=Candidatus Zymogenus saltonus TaxID=2844893 RepID=A0A9D8PJU7_9DELT|nr:3-deoxy-7-phosphoheptulonate synthase [Candidatus Zymogenus saltonus]